ncbi:hypothetical protein KLVA111870_00390 [Klebsiella variicola]|uniref:hypothetical protein n=1 Tax=Klebsiella variicola TaxID=244366 RepID=UPI00109BF31E|nr:hypothetical protein [Klebsiella variicola]VGP67086.1 hypothetical protein SB5387_00731 [Klebsiella variicola]
MIIPLWATLTGLGMIAYHTIASASYRNDMRDLQRDADERAKDFYANANEKLSDLRVLSTEGMKDLQERLIVQAHKRSEAVDVYNYNVSYILSLLGGIFQDGKETLAQLDNVRFNLRYNEDVLEYFVNASFEDPDVVFEQVRERFDNRDYDHNAENERFENEAEEVTNSIIKDLVAELRKELQEELKRNEDE